MARPVWKTNLKKLVSLTEGALVSKVLRTRGETSEGGGMQA